MVSIVASFIQQIHDVKKVQGFPKASSHQNYVKHTHTHFQCNYWHNFSNIAYIFHVIRSQSQICAKYYPVNSPIVLSSPWKINMESFHSSGFSTRQLGSNCFLALHYKDISIRCYHEFFFNQDEIRLVQKWVINKAELKENYNTLVIYINLFAFLFRISKHIYILFFKKYFMG